MARKQTGIRKRSDGRWEGRVRYRNPVTGKPTEKSVYATTQRECVRKRNKLQNEIACGLYNEPTKITLEEYMRQWLDNDCKHLKQTSKQTYQQKAEKYIYPVIGQVKLTELRKVHVRRFVESLNERPLENQDGSKKGKTLSPKYVRNLFGILHKALDQAVVDELIPKNVATGCKLPRCQKYKINVLEKEQMIQFIQEIREDRFESVFLIDLFTGMRKGEVLGLTWEHIDFDRGAIHICKQLQRYKDEYILVSPKHDSVRTMYPAQVVMDILQQRRAEQLEDMRRAGELWDNNMGLVFTDGVGHPLSPSTVYHHFKRIVAEIGVPELRFHDLRHSFTVNSIIAGEDMKTIQSNLGHTTATFTMEVYATYTDDMRRRSSQRQQKFIENLGIVGDKHELD